MDIGAVFDGYHSDMTRTVAVRHVTEEQQRIYDIVRNAQKRRSKEYARVLPANMPTRSLAILSRGRLR